MATSRGWMWKRVIVGSVRWTAGNPPGPAAAAALPCCWPTAVSCEQPAWARCRCCPPRRRGVPQGPPATRQETPAAPAEYEPAARTPDAPRAWHERRLAPWPRSAVLAETGHGETAPVPLLCRDRRCTG